MLRYETPMAAFVVALSFAVPGRAAAQNVTSTERSQAHVMLKQVHDEIVRNYLDTTWHGVNLEQQYSSLDARIDQGSSLGELMAAVAQLPLSLGDSHTFFVPPQQTVRSDYGWDAMAVGDSVYVRRVKAESDAERQGVHAGDLVLSLNGYRPTRGNLWKLTYLYEVLRPQPGLHVTLRSPGGETRELDLAAKVTRSPRILDLTGHDGGADINRILREENRDARENRSFFIEAGGHILVWHLAGFNVDRQTIEDLRKAARHDSALVVDLRGNPGGGVAQLLAITSALNRNDVVLGTQQERKRSESFFAKGGGDGAFTGRIVVLLDSRSASASEIFARVVQLTSRGLVLGDLSAGAVMRSRLHVLKQGMENVMLYGVSVTDADVVMTDGGSLEGVGVTPDTLVIPTARDLAAGNDPVLARALTILGHPVDARAAAILVKP